MPTKAKPKRKTVKLDGKVIGYVKNLSHSGGFLAGYVSAYYTFDGGDKTIGASPLERSAIAMIEEHHRRRTYPRKLWHVKLNCGATLLVSAATNSEAEEIARHRAQRRAKELFAPMNVRIAYEEELGQTGPRSAGFLSVHLGLINPEAT